MTCSYAGCTLPGPTVEDGWFFCAWHLAEHRALRDDCPQTVEGELPVDNGWVGESGSAQSGAQVPLPGRQGTRAPDPSESTGGLCP